MRKTVLVALLLTICTLPSCVSVGINDETQKRVDAITEQFKRLNDELEAFQKDIQALAAQIKKIVDKFEGKKPDGQ